MKFRIYMFITVSSHPIMLKRNLIYTEEKNIAIPYQFTDTSYIAVTY